MKKILPYSELSSREVPEYLDSRILARAAVGHRVNNCRNRIVVWGGIAAAVCITALADVYFRTELESSRVHQELIAMGDFSRLDQNVYNMSFELASGADLGQY
ncbi:MAG: hypothetical protein IKA87_02095 [Lentisphaeria bacterium]|nr:hypothetical protein [Lentisphaeria bacterium]